MGAVVPLSPRQQQLVTEALPLIDKVASVLARRTGFPVEELRSAGREAAAVASLRFDETVGTPFGGFALLRIKGAMMDAAFEHAGPMRATYTPAGAQRLVVQTISLDASESELGPLEDRATDLLASALLPSAASLEEAGWQQHLLSSLRQAIAELEPQERDLAHAFYWDALTTVDVAAKLKLSVGTTRRRHDQLKAKLWRAMRRRGAEP